MASIVLADSLMAFLPMVGLASCLPVVLAILWWQSEPPRPPQPPGPHVDTRLADIHTKLNGAKAVDVTAQRALQYSRSYWEHADKARRAGQSFRADRLAETADALLHVAEHQQHLRTGGGPKGPPSPEELQDHLQRVYLRTQQAEYFFRQSQDREAAAFPQWARDFYQLALRAYERKDSVAADENAKCADEIVKALENLAQAASPVSLPPPPKPPVP